MIITRAPFRISFFGGGTDYPEWFKNYGGAFLSLSIDKYAYITLRVKPAFLETRYRVSWRLQEDVSKISQIKHPIVRHSLIENKFDTGVDITYLGDLPGGTGVGSSSAFTVALNHALMSAQDMNPTPYDLSKIAYKIERDRLNEVIGIQDQIASSVGGFNYVTIENDGTYKINNLSMSEKNTNDFLDRCVLFYTGISRRASSVAEKAVVNIKRKENTLHKMRELVEEGYQALSKNDFDNFGLLLHENWLLKKSISDEISNHRIDEIYETGLKNGAIGGKLLGAGSGGFILFLCKNSGQQKDFIRKFSSDEIVQFKNSKKGSEVIFKD